MIFREIVREVSEISRKKRPCRPARISYFPISYRACLSLHCNEGYYNAMSKAEILSELPNLKAEERDQVFQRLCELQEDDLLHGVGPTAKEKKLLDDALAEFQRDGNPGTPWRDVLRQIRSSSIS
jgi:hypothetical protein